MISKRFLTVWGLKDAIKALPGLHALTGCDSTSAFVGKGKQAAFKIMHRSEENQSALQHLGESFELAEEVYTKLERFVCQLYGKASRNFNDLRYKLFFIKGLQSQQLPPTRDALRKHIYVVLTINSDLEEVFGKSS